jgi:hypothetical protein
MDATRKRRFRFGLRALLLLVAMAAICVFYFPLGYPIVVGFFWPPEQQLMKLPLEELTMTQVKSLLGKPDSVVNVGEDYEFWTYGNPHSNATTVVDFQLRVVDGYFRPVFLVDGYCRYAGTVDKRLWNEVCTASLPIAPDWSRRTQLGR